MERFTKRDAFGFHVNGVDFGDGSYLLAGQGFKTTQARGRAVDRLAAYEDTGLTPEEIKGLDDRATQVTAFCNSLARSLARANTKVTELLDAGDALRADNARLTAELDDLRRANQNGQDALSETTALLMLECQKTAELEAMRARCEAAEADLEEVLSLSKSCDFALCQFCANDTEGGCKGRITAPYSPCDAQWRGPDAGQRPEIVCLCGSTRFYKTFDEQNFRLTLEGKIVLSIGCNTKSDEGLSLTEGDKERLDELHKRKIDLCDRVLVLNVGGYIGSSTRSEIDYAQQHGKPVEYLEQQPDAGQEGAGND